MTIKRFIAEAGALGRLGMDTAIRTATLQRVDAAAATNCEWLR